MAVATGVANTPQDPPVRTESVGGGCAYPDEMPYPDEVAEPTWWWYVLTVTGGAPQKDVAVTTGIDQFSISRWQSGNNTPRVEAVVSFARAYARSPGGEALVAAGYFSSDELGVVN